MKKTIALIAALIANCKLQSLFALLPLLLLLPTFSFTQPGSLDNTFDTDGKVTTGIGSSWDYGYSAAIQSDGKIVVAGYSWTGSNDDFSVVRYNSDGSLDNTFDTDGKVTTAIGSSTDQGYSVAIQSDGKIVVAGNSTIGFNVVFAVVRYNSDGGLDNTFDSDGIVTTDFVSYAALAYSAAIQSDGKIVVAGYGEDGSDGYFVVVRYNSDGSLDNTFDTDGKVTTSIGSYYDGAYSAVIQSDGKIVVAGWSDNGSNNDFAVVRYNSDGSLDNTFDTDGQVTTAIGSSWDVGYSAAIQSDGKIVVAGESYNGSNNDFALVRYNSDGSLDNTFDSDGKVTTAFGSSNDRGYSGAIQSDGKIVMAGFSGNDFALVRYNSDGSLDNTFDTDGKVTTDFGSFNGYGRSAAIQSDGKIVVAGQSGSGSNLDFTVARYIGCSSTSSSTSVTACDSYTWQSATYSVSGTFMDTIPNATGCDSVMTLNLTINSSASSSTSATACDSYTWQSATYSVSGTYMDTIPNAAGCDSVMTLNLTINLSPSVTVTVSPDTVCINNPAFTLTGGSPNGGSYSGTGVSAGMFDPGSAGAGLHTVYYAYSDANGCSGIDSTKIYVDVCTSIAEENNDENFYVSIYPSPTSGQIQVVVAGGSGSKYGLEIYNVLGEKCLTPNPSPNEKGAIHSFDCSALPKGIYFVQVKTVEAVPAGRQGMVVKKLVISH